MRATSTTGSPSSDLSAGTPVWRLVINWTILAAAVIGLVVLIRDLGGRLGAPSFAQRTRPSTHCWRCSGSWRWCSPRVTSVS